jgi:hypothetical protein
MFHDLDEALRQLLIREMPVKNGEIDIKFDQPKREWSSRLNRPTLNIFLYDIRENFKLRQSQQWLVERKPDGSVVQRRTPVRLDVHYLITAWASTPDDEHNLLARALMALFRQPHLPADLLPDSLKNQPMPIAMQVAQHDMLQNPVDIWNALDNEVRPAIALTVTLSLDPHQSLTAPLVRTRELRIARSAQPAARAPVEREDADVFWTIGGAIHTNKPLSDLELILVERGLQVPIQEEGRFSISRLQAGVYTLEIRVNGDRVQRCNITVPAPDYDLEV